MDFKKYEDPALAHQFTEDALIEVGLWGHPRAGEAMQMAWKNGHEGGFPEVFQHLDDIANVIFEKRIDA